VTESKPAGPLPPLVTDTMVLLHFAKADRLDVLGASVTEMSTTLVVVDELGKYSDECPLLRRLTGFEWLQIQPQDSVEELIAFDTWSQLLGTSGDYDKGEASIFAAAQIHGLVALTDDRDATKVGRANGLEIHGTIWLLTRLQGIGKLVVALRFRRLFAAFPVVEEAHWCGRGGPP
jgi:predicted nucleic acid-binding protein